MAKNKRCPLQVECEKKCTFEGHELSCDYYKLNAREGYEIEDQEVLRREQARKLQEKLDEERYLDNTDWDYVPGEIVRLPIERLHPHPDNPRKNLGDLTEIADSIKAKGIFQNLTVVMKELADGRKLEEHNYTIIIGHRRRAASELAGLTHLPCVITTMTPQEQIETMAIENLQRKELTPYEQAECFQMMLDMGSTVEKITKDTGFSETTVRRRVKLLELDRKKFDKAEERGGTLQDYIKLNEIRDIKERNKVLDKIGTTDFNYYLQEAIKDQEFLDELAVIIQTLKEAAWCKERTNESYGWGKTYDETYSYFSKYSRKTIKPPKDTDVASYIYVVSEREVTVYRKGSKKKEKKNPEQVRKERLEKDAEKIAAKMQHISDIQKELRIAFVEKFAAFSTNQMEIETIAAKSIVLPQCNYTDVELLSRLANVPIKTKNYNKILEPAQWNKLLFHQSLRGLLYATYAMIEYGTNRYFTTSYESKPGLWLPKHCECTKLDLAYEGLRALGYEMSEEEVQMQNGTHPVFQEVKQLIEAYNKETKAAKAEKKKGTRKG